MKEEIEATNSGDANSAILTIGDLTLDRGKRVLFRAGEKIPLGKLSFRLFEVLVDAAPNIVTYDQIVDRVWGGRETSPETITQRVKLIRDGLGDDATNPRYISLIRGEGYRLIPAVEFASAEDHKQFKEKSTPQFHKILVTSSLLVVTALAVGLWFAFSKPNDNDQTIAVLPFSNYSGDSETNYFSDGMTDALIANLAKIQSLKVISRTSVMPFKNPDRSLPEIGKMLGASVIVESSIQRSGDNVRIIAQLIDVKTDEHLWAETYDRNIADILALQSEIAREIARQIHVNVTPEERARLESYRKINPLAYDKFLLGMHHVYRSTPEDLAQAERYFKEVLALDENSVVGLTGLIRTWTFRAQLGIAPATIAAAEVRTLANQLEAVDKQNALIQSALGTAAYLEFDIKETILRFRKAAELEPNQANTKTFLANALLIYGSFDEAIEQIEQAITLDPLNPFFRVIKGVVLLGAQDYPASIAAYREALALAPNMPLAYENLADTYHINGQYEEALAHERIWLVKAGNVEAVEALDAAAESGDYLSTMRKVAEVLERQALASNSKAVGVARHYYRIGDWEKVVEWLERGFEQGDPNIMIANVMDAFAPVRDDPRIKSLMRTINF